MKKVLITGADGFIGKNLQVHLRTLKIEAVLYTRNNSHHSLADLLDGIDFIFHLAGVNRPQNENDFKVGNTDFTKILCDTILNTKRKIPVLYTSSIQAELTNAYGKSKLDAETILNTFSKENDNPVYIYRLPNVFGKWAKPNYNSAVATFCHNIANDIPIQINDKSAVIRLVYVDDVIVEFIRAMNGYNKATFLKIEPEYEITVGNLAEKLYNFRASKGNLISEHVGTGFDRALYSTYLSYFSPEQFSYSLVKHSDSRGLFVEMLKTKDSGQFSYFTAHPGITRGGHYHHTKTEKFLVLKGEALFRFRHIFTNDYYELRTQGGTPVVVETIPGWSHDITNVGDDEMIVMLWANEIFDKDRPDTFVSQIQL